jgi:hypothetical protein
LVASFDTELRLRGLRLCFAEQIQEYNAMAMEITFIATLKTHKRWADRFSIASVVLVIGLSYLAAYLADLTKADEADRIGMYITMASVVFVVCIWQAAAFIVASIEFALKQRREDKGPWE